MTTPLTVTEATADPLPVVTIERIDLDTDAVADRIKRGIDTVADRDAAMEYAR
jgi:hypothetical protein